MLSSFRRDFALATQDTDTRELTDELEKVSPEFKQWWQRHDVHGACNGIRHLRLDDVAMAFEHTSLIVDADRHLRLVVYASSR